MNHTLREYVEGAPYCLAGALFAIFSAGALAGGHVPLGTAVALAGLAGAAFAAPFQSLLLFIAVSPIAAPIAPFVAPDMDGQLLAELLLTVCLTGVLFRFGLFKRSRRPLTTAEVLALLLIGLTATSAIAALGPEYIRLSNGESAAAWTWHLVSRDYFGGSGALRPLYDGMPLIEGLLLFILFAMSGGSETAGPAVRMLVLGAAAAAAFDIDKILLLLVRTGSVQQTVNAILNVRVTMTTRDPNAAGSYFAMALVPSVAMIGTLPTAGIVLTLVIMGGELLAGSRTAFAALAIAAGVAVLDYAVKSRGVRRALGAAAIAALAIASVPAAHYLANRSTNLSADRALDYRLGMWQKAARMTKQHPFFGIGIGEFAAESPMYEPTEGVFSLPENAHNQFLQVMAELGVSGLMAFVAIIAAALLHRYERGLTRAAALGLAVFLLSAVAGHPLLIRTVAFAFWAALAIASLAGRPARAPKALTIVTWVLVIALAATVPVRTHEALDNADFEHVGIGVSLWMADEAGRRYRVVSTCAKLFVPTDARRIEIALRPHLASDARLSVEMWEDGRLVNRIDLQGREWTTAVFTGGMPDARERRFSPIELRVWRNGAAVGCGMDVLDVQKIVTSP